MGGGGGGHPSYQAVAVALVEARSKTFGASSFGIRRHQLHLIDEIHHLLQHSHWLYEICLILYYDA